LQWIAYFNNSDLFNIVIGYKEKATTSGERYFTKHKRIIFENNEYVKEGMTNKRYTYGVNVYKPIDTSIKKYIMIRFKILCDRHKIVDCNIYIKKYNNETAMDILIDTELSDYDYSDSLLTFTNVICENGIAAILKNTNNQLAKFTFIE
jgi:hypothetical protein